MSSAVRNFGVSPGSNSLRMEITIATPPERVFKALTDPKEVSLWWGDAGTYRTTRSESDLRPGGKWASKGLGADGKSFEVYGEYIEVEPPKVLVFTWVSSWTGGLPSTVRWDLEPTTEGTLVKLHHSGLEAQAEAAKGYSMGWPRVLTWMKSFVEEGITVESRGPK